MAKAAALLACLLLSGCQSWHLGYHAQTGRSDASGRSAFSVRASAHGSDRVMDALVAAVLLAGAARYYLQEDGGAKGVEDASGLDPGRVVNRQDCAQAIDPQRGNLMCR